jgi:multiple sugar transport system ATP-binding protein
VAEFFGAPKINTVDPGVLRVSPPEGATIAAIRPEHLELGTGTAPEDALAGKVFLIEPLGSESHVIVELREARLTVRTSAEFDAKTGSPVWVRPRRDRVLYFDANGERKWGQATFST